MKNFENRAKAVLTADGLQERYTDRRIVGYDDLPKDELIWSLDISGILVDTYGMFDLTEECCGIEEGEAQHFTEEGCDFGDKFLEIEVDTKEIVEEMAEASIDILKRLAEEDGKKFDAELVAIYRPSEYNFTTDAYEMRITENPFKTTAELTEYLKSLIDRETHGDNFDTYFYDMNEVVSESLYNNITGYYIGSYDKLYTYEEVLKNFQKK